MDRATVVDQLRAVLSTSSGVRLALLFGSVARDQAKPGSDVDVALDAAAGVDVFGLAAQMSLAVGCEVHVVSLADPGVPLQQELVRDAVVIHEGVPGAAALWRSHTLADLEVDGPWYAHMRDSFLQRLAMQRSDRG